MSLQANEATVVSFQPLACPISGRITVPGSKSITNRALICAAMASGESLLTGVLDSEDTRVMVDAWQLLGLDLTWNKEAKSLRIVGCAGQPPRPSATLYIANSGTTIRFLTAALAATQGEYLLDGVPRMRERPIGDLLDGLAGLGANVTSTNADRPNCPPVRVVATGLRGGETDVAGDVSSQFLSGMMMAAPYARKPVTIRVVGELVSEPYVNMTAAVMRSFGVTVECLQNESGRVVRIDAPQSYRECHYHIEPDASAASYFLGVAAIAGGRVRIDGLSFDALQGDVGFARVLESMGCHIASGPDFIELQSGPLKGIDVDMNSISDTVQTLAAVALFASGPTRVRGVAHNRHKETDRIGDLARELRRVGARVEEHDDGLTIHPSRLVGADLQTYRDHRMAMSLSLIGLRVPNIRIVDPKCTEKTYPEFFEDMGKLIGQTPKYDMV
ncbi:MAG: 3-phosphoshikimate 1-carboxyvinyltransferase [Pirellula sp.]